MKEIKILKKLESKFKSKWFVLAVIAAVALIAYSDSFTVPFILDDFGSISNNFSIHNLFDFAGMWKFYANRIVLYFTLSINYFIHDNGVEGYHITNLLLHIFNGFLVYFILYYLLSLDYFKPKLLYNYRRVVSVAAAVLFICHPIQVNAVTYVIQRTASLAATFYFLAIFFFIKYRTQNKLYYLLLTLLFTLIAMFTKENTITIPFMLLIIELLFFMNDGKTSWHKRIIIFIVIFATVPVIPGTTLLLKGYSQSDPSATFKASTSMDRMQYFYTELNVILLYIRLMFIPDWQNFDYSNDYPVSKTIWDNYSYISLIILAATVLFGFYTFKRNRLVTLGIIWFYMGLAVESSFISIKDVYFEHRLYFPCVGFIMFLLGMIFYDRKQRSVRQYHLFRKPLLMFLTVTVLLTALYTGLTFRRNYVYSDSIRLWTDIALKAPGSGRAHSVLATSYLNAYDNRKKNTEYLDLAEEEFIKAIDIYYSDSTAHCNLSKVYYLDGKFDKCIDEAQKTLNITKSEYANYNMGLAYKKLGKTKDALNAYLEGYRTNSRSTFILQALGDTYYEMKDYKNARFYYEEYLKNSRDNNSSIKKKIKDMGNKNANTKK